MNQNAWVKEFPGAVTVCDTDGKIIEMNRRAVEMFGKNGGEKLLGSNVLDCHPEPAQSNLKAIMQTQRINVYTIEKAGRKKLIFQAPWYQGGVYAGVVELSLEIPSLVPHFVRD
jgi:transcriptional regulator with PAS, ATPase and Fis domain